MASITSLDQNTRYLNELENISQKERFGLFTQPPGLSIGEKFQQNYDPYLDQYKIKQIEDKSRYEAIPNSVPFQPTDTKKSIVNSQFKHLKEYNDKVYNTRDFDGQVITGPQNFYTNPMKQGNGNSTVGHLFEKLRYAESPFDNSADIQREDRASRQSQVISPNQPFCGMSKGNNLFTNSYQTYAIPGTIQIQENPAPTKSVIFHPKPFVAGIPPQRGYNQTLDKFPEYLEQGSIEINQTQLPSINTGKTPFWMQEKILEIFKLIIDYYLMYQKKVLTIKELSLYHRHRSVTCSRTSIEFLAQCIEDLSQKLNYCYSINKNYSLSQMFVQKVIKYKEKVQSDKFKIEKKRKIIVGIHFKLEKFTVMSAIFEDPSYLQAQKGTNGNIVNLTFNLISNINLQTPKLKLPIFDIKELKKNRTYFFNDDASSVSSGSLNDQKASSTPDLDHVTKNFQRQSPQIQKKQISKFDFNQDGQLSVDPAQLDSSEHLSQFIGFVSLGFGILFTITIFFTMILAKFLPATDNILLEFLRTDTYYAILAPLLAPVIVVFCYANWVFMKFFRHS